MTTHRFCSGRPFENWLMRPKTQSYRQAAPEYKSFAGHHGSRSKGLKTVKGASNEIAIAERVVERLLG